MGVHDGIVINTKVYGVEPKVVTTTVTCSTGSHEEEDY